MRNKRLITSYSAEDTIVVGIATALKPHKLAWLINRVGALALVRGGHDLEKGYNDLLHFLFEIEHCHFLLIKNGFVSEEGATVGYLIPHCKEFDFFFAIQDFTSTFELDAFYAALRATQQLTCLMPLSEEKWNKTDLVKILGS